MTAPKPHVDNPASGADRFEQQRVSDRITKALTRNVKDIAETSGATAIFVYADALGDETLWLPGRLEHNVYYVSKTAREQKQQEDRGTAFIRVPNVNLSRLGQVKIAVFLALTGGLVKTGDVVVCLSGVPASGTLDTIVVTQVGQELETFVSSEGDQPLPQRVLPEVVARVVDLASELGNEGREGKPVGALFVIGDDQRVQSLSRQLILNPFRGYPEEERNILNESLEETIKELSTIDGAFIVRGDGVIETCGAFLKTASQEEFAMPQGLGARHHAAAAITAVTDSIAVTVSESTGTVMVFRNGKIVTEIERLRSLTRIPRPFASAEED